MNCVRSACGDWPRAKPSAGVLMQVDADSVVLADLGPAQPREERPGLIGVRGPRHAC